MHQYIDTSGHFVFGEFFLAQTFFPQKIKKFNISAIYKSTVTIFSENLPLVFICKFIVFCSEIQLQQPEKPQEHRVGEVYKEVRNQNLILLLSVVSCT